MNTIHYVFSFIDIQQCLIQHSPLSNWEAIVASNKRYKSGRDLTRWSHRWTRKEFLPCWVIVYKNFFLQFSQNYLSKAWLKRILIDSHCKTIYGSVRSESYSCSVHKAIFPGLQVISTIYCIIYIVSKPKWAFIWFTLSLVINLSTKTFSSMRRSLISIAWQSTLAIYEQVTAMLPSSQMIDYAQYL